MSKPTIFLDMDGVVADFDTYALTVLGVKGEQHRWPPESWKKLASNPRLYRDLEQTPESNALVEICRYLRDYRGYRLFFLTAVPKDNTMHFSFQDKVEWVQKRYPDIPVHFGPYSVDKHKHCRCSDDILIDDRRTNIESWRAVGGKGILHEGDLFETIVQLQRLII